MGGQFSRYQEGYLEKPAWVMLAIPFPEPGSQERNPVMALRSEGASQPLALEHTRCPCPGHRQRQVSTAWG